MMKYKKIEDEWITEKLPLAYNDNGIRLFLLVRFDGNGNAVVRYVVNNMGSPVTYEKHDSAVDAYQMACDKQERM